MSERSVEHAFEISFTMMAAGDDIVCVVPVVVMPATD